MILEKPIVNTTNNLGVASVAMTIDSSSIEHIKRVLGNLYRDPIQAIVREYSTNAYDSHIMAGKAGTPIRVTPPTTEDCNFTVEDFGLGLSEEEVYTVYGAYGASLKRHTNDLNGQLGFGCKSAFSYAENFAIVSTHNGIRTTYSIFQDGASGGQILKMGSHPVDEPNGVKVIIPVKRSDIYTFNNTMNRVYRYFDVAPVNTLNDQPYTSSTTPVLLEWDGVKIALNNNDRDYGIVMGNVRYPVDSETSKQLGQLFNKYVDIYVPMGAVTFTPSRENTLRDGKTTRYVTSLISVASSLVISTVKEKAKGKKLFERAYAVMDYVDTFNIKNDIITAANLEAINLSGYFGYVRMETLFKPELRKHVTRYMEREFYESKDRDNADKTRPFSKETSYRINKNEDFTIVVGTIKAPGLKLRRATANFLKTKSAAHTVLYMPIADTTILDRNDVPYIDYTDFTDIYAPNTKDKDSNDDPVCYTMSVTNGLGSRMFTKRGTYPEGKILYVRINRGTHQIMGKNTSVRYSLTYSNEYSKMLFNILKTAVSEGYTVIGLTDSQFDDFVQENPTAINFEDYIRDAVARIPNDKYEAHLKTYLIYESYNVRSEATSAARLPELVKDRLHSFSTSELIKANQVLQDFGVDNYVPRHYRATGYAQLIAIYYLFVIGKDVVNSQMAQNLMTHFSNFKQKYPIINIMRENLRTDDVKYILTLI